MVAKDKWSFRRDSLRPSIAVDRLGVLASGTCAAHCVVCALLPGVLGALGLGALLGHEAEWTFTLVAVLFAAAATAIGWRRHGSLPVTFALAAGAMGLLCARLLEERGMHGWGPIVGVFAGLILLFGHVGNARASQRCRVQCP